MRRSRSSRPSGGGGPTRSVSTSGRTTSGSGSTRSWPISRPYDPPDGRPVARRRVGRRPDGRRRRQGADAPPGRRPGRGPDGRRDRADPARAPEGRRARNGAGRRDHGREADERAHPAMPSAAAHARGRDAGGGRGVGRDRRVGGDDRTDRRRDGGAHGRFGRGAHGLRHGQGGGQGDADRRRRPGREDEGERRLKAAVLTVSDGVAAGTREDRSGDVLDELLRTEGYEVERRIVPDEREEIAAAVRDLASSARLVLTTGGTGLAPRDVTPEATCDVLEREAPGIAQALWADSIAKTPHGLLSRGAAGVLGSTLVVNLPGSTGGCRDGFAVLRPALAHALELLADVPTAHEQT